MRALTTTGAPRRVRAIATAELRLLVRNRTAMFTALALPLITVAGLSAIGFGENGDLPLGALVVTMLAGFTLLYVVYYNLVSAYVARREDLVLKRLRVGELTDAEILAGTALPSVVVAVTQVVLTAVVAALALGLDMPANALLVVVAVVGGVVMFVLLAAASTAFTRNVEMAQVSTLPVLFLCMGSLIFSGVVVPADSVPDAVQDVFQFVPLTPVLDLLQLGLTGRTADGDTVGFGASFSAAAFPLIIMGLWIVNGIAALRRWFRWEPRT
ncbi:ABC transporter permease [Jiangella aurantiaca]|uniref:ABC transporter permease n=1 Tax=Jiangella aurantiaca TaxID=2530373 RepID=A0A4R5AIX1_9ACTN|nr:ABC transporter permease [Jiangella aurantiaca]TDD71329.1 ABC transporter permease [Jiangella aurantiaca]